MLINLHKIRPECLLAFLNFQPPQVVQAMNPFIAFLVGPDDAQIDHLSVGTNTQSHIYIYTMKLMACMFFVFVLCLHGHGLKDCLLL